MSKQTLHSYVLFFFKHEKIKYICCGIWNTIFGYTLMILLYNLLQFYLHITVIGAISSVISIMMSFTTYKYLVFNTKGNYFIELMRSFVVYSSGSVAAIIFVWLMVDFLGYSIYVANGLSVLVIATITYFGHKFFTFKIKDVMQ